MRPSTRLTSPPTRGFPKAFFSLVISCNSPSLPTYLEILSKTCELENLCPPWRLVKWGSRCNKNPKERLVYLKIERNRIDWLMLASSCSLLTARGQKEGRRHPPGLTEERNAACWGSSARIQDGWQWLHRFLPQSLQSRIHLLRQTLSFIISHLPYRTCSRTLGPSNSISDLFLSC